MTQTPYASIARITKTHGLHGEVVAVPAGDLTSIERLESLLTPGFSVFIVPPVAGLPRATVRETRRTPKGILVSFDGVTDINAAQVLVGHGLLVLRSEMSEDALAADADELSPDAFIGVAVYDEVHGDLGEIIEVIITGANDVWAVEGPYGEVLIPVIEQVVLGRDEGGTIVVRLLEGLLPGEAEEIPEEGGE